MTSGAKPTPGPWVLAGWYIQGTEQDIGDGDVGRLNIATCAVEWSSNRDPEQQANARLIVRAVNCHADLVDGCNALLGLLQLLCARDDAPAWLKDAFETSHRVTEARAALAKVGETE